MYDPEPSWAQEMDHALRLEPPAPGALHDEIRSMLHSRFKLIHVSEQSYFFATYSITVTYGEGSVPLIEYYNVRSSVISSAADSNPRRY